jgi:glyoxylase-like metal-dependent hydrolase (beta-lactamase superfamily II)/ferredoxin
MADLRKKVAENIAGEFFVDTTCIDCDTCRQLAPRTFAETGDYSFVFHQPDNEQEIKAALHALLSCPTGSIGTESSNDAKLAIADFPLPIDGSVYYCGFNSPKSYGGSSYLIRHPEGNWLVDSPKFLPHLVQKFRAWGGISHIFLTHSDDVGDAHQYAETFGAKRIIHQAELWSQPNAEIVLDGFEPVLIQPDFRVIPTPGHSPGHCSLLYQETYLYTGDHLWWDRDRKALDTPEHYFWNKAEQLRSAEKLLAYPFQWILPGHGQRIHLSDAQMKAALQELIDRKAYLYHSENA